MGFRNNESQGVPLRVTSEINEIPTTREYPTVTGTLVPLEKNDFLFDDH